MREQSERVPGKNFRPFAGDPLYHRICQALLACDLIDEIVIDTDSQRIAADARSLSDRIRIIDRPQHLRDGATPMNEVLLHDISQVPADFYLQTHSTNPLLKTDTIRRGIERLLSDFPAHDSLFSVTPLNARLWDQLTRPINHNPAILLRTQDLPAVFVENSCMYIFTAETLKLRRNRIGERPVMFPIPLPEAWDIDEEVDFDFAETLYKRGNR
jgi:CMP-N-acetylneuraminic acid synthetase